MTSRLQTDQTNYCKTSFHNVIPKRKRSLHHFIRPKSILKAWDEEWTQKQEAITNIHKSIDLVPLFFFRFSWILHCGCLPNISLIWAPEDTRSDTKQPWRLTHQALLYPSPSAILLKLVSHLLTRKNLSFSPWGTPAHLNPSACLPASVRVANFNSKANTLHWREGRQSLMRRSIEKDVRCAYRVDSMQDRCWCRDRQGRTDAQVHTGRKKEVDAAAIKEWNFDLHACTWLQTKLGPQNHQSEEDKMHTRRQEMSQICP